MSTATSRNGTGDPCTRSSWDDPILAAGEHDDEEAAAAISTVGGSVWYLEENNGQPQQQQPKWELTWPIWHMLPRMERRALAQKHGYKTIGEFEEFMILQRAVGDSSSGDATYDNQHLYVPPTKEMDSKETAAIARTAASASLKSSPNEEFDNDDNSVDHDPDDNDDYIVSLENMALSSTSPSTLEELYERGGKILMLPDDLLHRICSYLPVDTYARLALVSPLWKSFTRTEATYKRLCERLYLNQCRQRRALHVSRFNHSYRTMLEKRPRVRAGGGVYVMKYARVRKIQRDMWTEVCTYTTLHSSRYA